MKLSIVIPVYNKYAFTASTLKDLFQLDPLTHEIIIIDNASTDETSAELSKITNSNFKLIVNTENKFHSYACNQGYEKATGENVLFINNDIKIKSNHSNWTDTIINNCDKVVGPTMGLLDKNFSFIKEENKLLQGNSYISGWCIASSKNNWNKLGSKIWDERLPMYFNDADLSFRIKKKNIPIGLVDIPVVHFGRISSSQFNVNKFYTQGLSIFTNKWKK